jgi:hypothetical protein
MRDYAADAAKWMNEEIARRVEMAIRDYLAMPGHERERHFAEEAVRLAKENIELRAEIERLKEKRSNL